MAVNKTIREVRCMDALAQLDGLGRAVFFTLTTPDVVGIDVIRARWRKLRNSLLRHMRREGMAPLYVMNYERHPGYLQKVVTDRLHGERVLHGTGRSHGWHIHGVMNDFVPVEWLRPLADSSGFGRLDVRKVTSKGVADYLTKHALKAYRGLSRKERRNYEGFRLRLVNTSRGLPRLSDYRWESDLIRETARIRDRIKSTIAVPSRHDFRRVHQAAELCAMLGLRSLDELRQFVQMVCMGGKATGKKKQV